MQITKTHLAFLEEAKKAFAISPKLKTYRNQDDSLIALRTGEDEDCIQIFELGQEVALFAQYLEPNSVVILRDIVSDFSIQMEKQLRANDHKKGWKDSSDEFLLNELARHAENLSELLGRIETFSSKKEITKRCANIANFAMMIADNEGEPL